MKRKLLAIVAGNVVCTAAHATIVDDLLSGGAGPFSVEQGDRCGNSHIRRRRGDKRAAAPLVMPPN